MTPTFVRSAAAILIVAGTALATGCASQPEPRPVTLDPANPTAPESPPPPASQALAPERHAPERVPSDDVGAAGMPASPMSPPQSVGEIKGGEAEHDGRDRHGPGSGSPTSAPPPGPSKKAKDAAVFTCPMHPEVLSPKPGRCPKCGMKLVPKGASGSGDSK